VFVVGNFRTHCTEAIAFPRVGKHAPTIRFRTMEGGAQGRKKRLGLQRERQPRSRAGTHERSLRSEDFFAVISTAKRDKMTTIRVLVSFRQVVKGLNFGWPEPATPADEHRKSTLLDTTLTPLRAQTMQCAASRGGENGLRIRRSQTSAIPCSAPPRIVPPKVAGSSPVAHPPRKVRTRCTSRSLDGPSALAPSAHEGRARAERLL
jgi:hypothetical protein